MRLEDMYPMKRSKAKKSMLGVLLIGGIFCITGCGSKSPHGNANNNGVIPCENEEDCPPGWICEGNICVNPDGGMPDTSVEVPVIHVVPTTLDFGSPLLNLEEIRSFEIHNQGLVDLVVSRIEILEGDSLKEFTSDPEGVVSLIIPPNGSTTVPVTLISVDAELDSGQVRITSNDPATPEVLVSLMSSYKGIPNLEACVFAEDATSPYPTHPFSDCEVDWQGKPVIDFQVVSFEVPEERVLVIYNTAEGNYPLAINEIAVDNQSGNADTYTLSLFVQDPVSGDATPVVLPTYLSAGDTDTPPDLLYIRVAFDASVDIFPADQLVISSNDADAQTYINIIGVVSGCPEDYWDINGDPSDGCEYYCVFQQTTDDCNTPDDDNCNGVANEEGSDNCTVYYRDHDGDTFGSNTDSRCLCAPEGEYNVTISGDCDDNNSSVNPNATETCATPYDDNCNGTNNDLNAAQCITYYRDVDGDSYGRTSDTQCRCQAQGEYTATTGGDCDDDPAACGANCYPGNIEICTSPTDYDNNCNGVVNEQNAQGCTTYYRDLDGDTYGDSNNFQCWCQPTGSFTSTTGTDCDDNPAMCGADCYPGNTEVCDGMNRDNDCDGIPDSQEFNFQSNPLHCGGCNNVCTATAQSTCGQTGNCVNGNCELWPAYTPCVDQFCSGSTLNYADRCNGSGQCVDQGTLSCAPYMCDSGGVNCRTSCTADSDCVSGYYCNTSINECRPKKDPGNTCSGNNECLSNFCVDGYCCNSACTGECRACDISGSLGICTNFAINTDPDDECGGTCRSCNGSGACRNTPQGLDPEEECAAQGQSTCGTTGVCNGSAACEYWASGTVCVATQCDGTNNWQRHNADTCNGSGTCSDNGLTDCTPYACESAACRNNCINDLNCRTGYSCLSNVCCNAYGPNSGDTCGTGDLYSYTNNDAVPVNLIFYGRIVPVGDTNWYRFRVYEQNLDDLNFYVYLSDTAEGEFEVIVNKSASSVINCTSLIDDGCESDWGYNRYQSTQTCPPSGACSTDTSKTFYVGVRRKTGFTATCNQYTLRIRIGGPTPP